MVTLPSAFMQALAVRSLLSLVSVPPLFFTVTVSVCTLSSALMSPAALRPLVPTAVVVTVSVPPCR